MKKRQFIIVAVAIIILVLAKLGKDYIATPAEREKPTPKEQVVTVFTETVTLTDLPIDVSTTGSLEAKERMELYSEVQGLMLSDKGRFKAGNRFTKGQTLLSVRADDARASVIAQRSAFERSLSAVMADLRIDYPDAYDSWSRYLSSIDVNSFLAELPAVSDKKLKSYLTGRDIYASYYNVRNAEIGLSRYSIRAPFNGTLITANADPGTIIRSGQLLGVFIKPGKYELQASTDSRTISLLKKGQEVTLNTQDGTGSTYTGTISRINSSIDPSTQLCAFFVEVESDKLREGEFLTVVVSAQKAEKSFQIPRSALKDSKYAYVVEDGKLKSVELNVLHFNHQSAFVQGLENGHEVLTKLPPAAFEGMNVKVFSEPAAK